MNDEIKALRTNLYAAARAMNAARFTDSDYAAKVASWRAAQEALSASSPALETPAPKPVFVRRTVLGAVYVRGGC